MTREKGASDLPDTPTLDALQKVLDDPEVQAKLRGLGTEGRKMTPAQYDALLRKEDAGAAAMIKDGLLKGE